MNEKPTKINYAYIAGALRGLLETIHLSPEFVKAVKEDNYKAIGEYIDNQIARIKADAAAE
jgi:hypothetical protein